MEFARDLESAPEGYQSCRGVKNQSEVYPTEFEQDEYVIYSVNQQKIKYLVEFSLPGDDVMPGVADDVIGSDG
jgi:poly [ADP-ribose] polymerase